MTRIIILSVCAAAGFPAFSMLANAAGGGYNGDLLSITLFPALVGVAAGIACRDRQPLASGGVAAAAALTIVGIAAIAWARVAGDASAGIGSGQPSTAALVRLHSARAIMAFFIGLGAAAVITFGLAYARKPAAGGGAGSMRLRLIAGAVLASLWAALGISWLAARGEPSPDAAAALTVTLETGTIAELERARIRLIELGPQAVPGLVDRLRSRRVAAVCYAARTLGDIGDPRALQPLMEVLERSRRPEPGAFYESDENSLLAADLPAIITIAVQQVSGRDFGGEPDACIDWWLSQNKTRTETERGD